jgi:uncharacterized protein (DUF58 family)
MSPENSQLRPDINDLLGLQYHSQALGLASKRPVDSALSGLYHSVFRGQGVDFEEVREYREGDEIRNMDWRVTARTGTPHLKVFREERQRTVMLCVDLGSSMNFGTRGTFKSIQAARAAALLGWAASYNHDKLGGILYGVEAGIKYYQPANSRRALWRMLKTITENDYSTSQSESALIQMLQKLLHGTPSGSLLFLIGDFNSDLSGVEQALGRLLQKHEVVILAIDDIAERQLPKMGKMSFIDGAGQEIYLDTNDKQGRNNYTQAWDQQRKWLMQLCNRLSIDMIAVKTDDDVHDMLLQGLRKRGFRISSR